MSFVVTALGAAQLCAADGSQEPDRRDRAGSARPATEGTDGTRHLGALDDLDGLTLIKSSAGTAVVRFGTGPLELISVGDHLGRHKAEVTEIDAGRMVVEETFTGADGRPNHAQIILKDGEKGGRRYIDRPEEQRPSAVRPKAIRHQTTPGTR